MPMWIWVIVALFGKDVIFWFMSSPAFIFIFIVLGVGVFGLVSAGNLYIYNKIRLRKHYKIDTRGYFDEIHFNYGVI
jgi:hypothetical protein